MIFTRTMEHSLNELPCDNCCKCVWKPKRLEQLETKIILFFLSKQKEMDCLPLDETVLQEEYPLATMLKSVGVTKAQDNRIREECFDEIQDIGIEMLEEQDIKDLVTTFSCFSASSRISFRIAWTKRLIAMIYWVQDHERVSLTASIAVGKAHVEMKDTSSKVL